MEAPPVTLEIVTFCVVEYVPAAGLKDGAATGDSCAKFAVKLLSESMITVPGDPPVNAPLNPVNWYPEFAAAVTVTCVPALCQPPDGFSVIAPAPGGATVVLR
jgi:hypothetical protein